MSLRVSLAVFAGALLGAWRDRRAWRDAELGKTGWSVSRNDRFGSAG